MIIKVFLLLSIAVHVNSITQVPKTNRYKRQTASWVWESERDEFRSTLQNNVGSLRRNPVTTSRTTTPVSANKEDDPCTPYTATMPDFSKSNKRISTVKCAEYIWQIWYREKLANKSTECFSYRVNKAGPNGPFFAIGGRDTNPGEFPHMGALGWKATVGTWIFKCGGSLISPKFVLTAAHCSKGSEMDSTIVDTVPKIVRLGDKNIIDVFANGQQPLDVNINKIIVHPDYVSPKAYNDIALIEVDQEVVFTQFVQPACLWSSFDVSSLGKEATITGWGVVQSGGLSTSPELQAAVVDIIDLNKCDELLQKLCNRRWCGIQETQLCAGKLAGGVDACQGDSGGPLQVKISLPVTSQGQIHYVIGVTSFGIGCAKPNTPGVYTRVSSYIDWIESVVWG